VRKSSESCARVCELLLLVELLRRRHPGLKTVEPESLLNLAGGPRRPPREAFKAGVAFVKKELKEIPPKNRPSSMEELLILGLREGMRIIPFGFELPDSPDEILKTDTTTEEFRRENPDLFRSSPINQNTARQGLVERGLIAEVATERGTTKTQPQSAIAEIAAMAANAIFPFGPAAGVELLADPDFSEPLCRFVGTFFFAALIRAEVPAAVRAASAALALSCGVAISRGT